MYINIYFLFFKLLIISNSESNTSYIHQSNPIYPSNVLFFVSATSSVRFNRFDLKFRATYRWNDDF